MKMEDQQKEADKEVTDHVKEYLPKAIFVLKDLIKHGNTNTKMQKVNL